MEIALSTAKVTALREADVAQYRTPPHNSEAEQALLGAILVNNAAYHHVAEFLLAEHFADAVHGRIYAAAGKLIERGQIANQVTLKNLSTRTARSPRSAVPPTWRAWPPPSSPSSTSTLRIRCEINESYGRQERKNRITIS